MRASRGDTQAKILAYIKKEIRDKGYPPSVREICDAVGLKSTSTVHGHLTRMEKKGVLRRDSTKPRAMEVLDENFARGMTVPVIGKITAGTPILAQENIEDHLMLPLDFVGDEETFALRVQGESMIGAGILDGDYVVIHRQSSAQNGEIVAAIIEDEATLKRIYYEKNQIRLQPENDTMNPIFTREAKVLGKAITLIRKI